MSEQREVLLSLLIQSFSSVVIDVLDSDLKRKSIFKSSYINKNFILIQEQLDDYIKLLKLKVIYHKVKDSKRKEILLEWKLIVGKRSLFGSNKVYKETIISVKHRKWDKDIAKNFIESIFIIPNNRKEIISLVKDYYEIDLSNIKSVYQYGNKGEVHVS